MFDVPNELEKIIYIHATVMRRFTTRMQDFFNDFS